LDLKRKKGLSARLAIFAVILLACALLVTGCVRGMTPIGWSGFAAGNGYLYTGSKEGRLVSINLSNNSLQFAEPLRVVTSGVSCYGGSSGGACGGSAPSIAIYGTPALSNVPVLGSLVYIAGYNGKVFAYDASSLQQRWVYPVDGNLSPIVSALTISGDTLYFGCTDKNVYALDTSTGAKKWQFATGGEIWSSPAVDNNIVFISSFDKKIYALDAITGDKKWDFPTGANNVAPPFTLDNVVYVGSLDRNLYALDETSGNQLWKYEGKNWFWARPVAVKGVIYAPCLDNRVYGLEAKTGKKLAEYNVEGQVASWPVVVNNQVIIAAENGKLWSLDTDNPNASLKMISSIPENVTCPLAAVNDVIYINGPDNNLYAYNIVTGAKFSPISLSSK
jgi:outer membrane protein assembly factor BamB